MNILIVYFNCRSSKENSLSVSAGTPRPFGLTFSLLVSRYPGFIEMFSGAS